jgi:hypothetical protein
MKGFMGAREKSSLLLPLQGSPPPQNSRAEACRCRGLVYLGPGGLLLVGLLLEWNWQRDVKNPLAADQGEMFPGAAPL